MIYVTHDQVEAMTLATRVAVFNAGVLQQAGPPLELYHRPDNRFVAGFLGSPSMNFLPATRRGDEFKGAGFSLPAPSDAALPETVLVGLRPQDVRVSTQGPLSGQVDAVERLGFDGFAFLTTEAGPVAARFDKGTQVAVGDRVRVEPVGDALHVFSADGERALRHPPGTPG
jgi:multiple sugar transport system ATP-binding protein